MAQQMKQAGATPLRYQDIVPQAVRTALLQRFADLRTYASYAMTSVQNRNRYMRRVKQKYAQYVNERVAEAGANEKLLFQLMKDLSHLPKATRQQRFPSFQKVGFERLIELSTQFLSSLLSVNEETVYRVVPVVAKMLSQVVRKMYDRDGAIDDADADSLATWYRTWIIQSNGFSFGEEIQAILHFPVEEGDERALLLLDLIQHKSHDVTPDVSPQMLVDLFHHPIVAKYIKTTIDTNGADMWTSNLVTTTAAIARYATAYGRELTAAVEDMIVQDGS